MSVITTTVDWNLLIKSLSQNPRTLPSSMMPTRTYFHTFKHMPLMKLSWNPLLLASREVSELLHRNIGNIDISTQQTLFVKIQEHFCDWIKTCYYRKKEELWYSKLVWIKKWCHLFFKAIWRLLMMIAPFCQKQIGLSASSCWLWKAP